MTWSARDISRLEFLALDRSLLATEIAERLGKSAEATRHKMRRLGFDLRDRALSSGKIGGWNAKHQHLRARAMRYFLSHTFEETMARFGLSWGELKSLQTVAYRDPKLVHLRKDHRRHDAWSFEETMFLLRHAGLQNRLWIARRLKRGGVHAVKEMISRLGSNTRYMNGLPKRLAEEIVGHEVQGFKVQAGPDGRHAGVDFRPIIVPWVVLYSEARRAPTVPAHILDAIRAMSRFQKRVHGTRGLNDTVASVIRAIAGH